MSRSKSRLNGDLWARVAFRWWTTNFRLQIRLCFIFFVGRKIKLAKKENALVLEGWCLKAIPKRKKRNKSNVKMP